MFVVIFRFRGERYELNFTANERAAAEAIALRYGTQVCQLGALVSHTPLRKVA